MFGRIMKAFDPIIELLASISYPVAYIVIGAGIIIIMLGQKRKGLETIKWASIGYLLMQFLPGLMKILRDVGQAMRG